MNFLDENLKIGFNISKKPKLSESFLPYLDSPLQAFQLFIKNARNFDKPKISDDDLINTQKCILENNFYFVIHGGYQYNMCMYPADSDTESAKLDFYIDVFTSEIDIGAVLNTGVILHIGSCANRKEGITQLARSLEKCIDHETITTSHYADLLGISVPDFKKKRKIILENCAGEGSKIGTTIQELSEIYNAISDAYRSQIYFCIDTAHIHGDGEFNFALADDVTRFFKEFSEKIGIEKIEVIHLNDSKIRLGGKADRHESWGDGTIFSGEGIEGFKMIVEYARKYKIPLIGEPPKERTGIECFEFLKKHVNIYL